MRIRFMKIKVKILSLDHPCRAEEKTCVLVTIKWKYYLWGNFRFREFIHSHRNKPVENLFTNWNMFRFYLSVRQSKRKKCPSPPCMIGPCILKSLTICPQFFGDSWIVFTHAETGTDKDHYELQIPKIVQYLAICPWY